MSLLLKWAQKHSIATAWIITLFVLLAGFGPVAMAAIYNPSSSITTPISNTNGGTGQDTSGYTGILGINSGTYYQSATTTAGTGLTVSGNSLNVNSSQSIATLSNLSTNGVIYTSGSNGTLNIDVLPLDVANGGSGALTLTGILLGNGTGAFTGLTTSAGIFGAISDETGSGSLVGSVAPALTGAATAVGLQATNSTSTGKMNIPNGSSPSVAVTGDCALDTTSDQFKCFGNTATKVYGNGYQTPSFKYSTSTAWTGTTTQALGPAFYGETWDQVKCFTDTGTVGVSFWDGTTRMTPYIPTASTTVGTNNLTTNNTFAAGVKRYVDIGNPSGSPTSLSCSVRKAITAD